MPVINEDESTAGDVTKEALDHAWNWFSLHAGQRLQCVYFFVLASAALVAGFASTLTANKQGTAFVITLVGTFISIVFNLLERRTKELVKAGEAAMREFERRLTAKTGVAELMLVERVEETKITRAASYSKAINAIHEVAVVAWIGAAVYVWRLMYPGGTPNFAGLNVLGLALNAAGVALLFFFGMPFRVRTGGDTVTWKADKKDSSVLRQERYYAALAYLGFVLILLGTAAQSYVSFKTLR